MFRLVNSRALSATGAVILYSFTTPGAPSPDVVAYWRFEPGAILADAVGGGPKLVRVGEGVRAAPPVAPRRVPLTGQANRGATGFTGRGAIRAESNGRDALAFADGRDFTIECWFRAPPRIGVNVIFSKVREDPSVPGTRSHGFDFLTIPNGSGPGVPLHFRIYTHHDGLIYLLRVNDALRPNRTYHLALTRKGTTYRMYIDGRLRAEATSSATIHSDGDLFIGALGLGDRPYPGHLQPRDACIDEVRISNRARLPNEMLLFPRKGETAQCLTADGPGTRRVPAWQHGPGEVRRFSVNVVPGVYDVRVRFAATSKAEPLDLAVNGRSTLERFRPPAGREATHAFRSIACPSGKLVFECLSATGQAPKLNKIEIIATDEPIADVTPVLKTDAATGWELPLPTADTLIPKPVKLRVQTARVPNVPPAVRYIPSQKFPAYPERINPRTRNVVTGIKKLAPYRQRPLEDGVRFTRGQGGYFEIHHRRAGVRCYDDARFLFRMEQLPVLAALRLGVRAPGGDVVWFGQFERRSFEVSPGCVRYDIQHRELKLSALIDVVSPAAAPAYGMITRVQLHDESGKARRLELVACVREGAEAPRSIPTKAAPTPGPLKLDTPRKNPPVDSRRPNAPPLLLHDTDYDVLVGFDGGTRIQATAGGRTLGVALRAVELTARGESDAYLTALIDSPGFDEPSVRRRIQQYFDRNKNLPAPLRRRMTENALDTFARIVVNGDKTFQRILHDPAGTFDACVQAWGNGVYRNGPVRFDLPDKRLQAMANLTANDLFPGLVSPPGLVHDAKYGDHWNFIFCYRHVHAASDVALQRQALDYMRLLSANQQPNGQIRSLRADFRSPGHGTRFNASYVDALTHYYRWTGDLNTVRELWPTLVRAMQYVDASLDPDGDGLYKDIVHQWKSDFDNRGPSSSYQTAIVRRAYADLAFLADRLGKPGDAKRYRTKAEKIRRTAQAQLWSNEMAMLGSKGPLGILRLHPQSLEVEMPVWTGLVDPYQAYALTDWYYANLAFRDEAGGVWMYDNDWWPVVWSQHMPAQGDAMMVAWALMLAGRHEDGADILSTLAGSSFRSPSPGFNYTFNSAGVCGGNDPATVQGAFIRALVEGLFGVQPAIDEGRIVVRPRFPRNWPRARFVRPGLQIEWRRQGTKQTCRVRTPDSIRPVVEFCVRAQVQRVSVDGTGVPLSAKPDIRHAVVSVALPPGGGRAVVETGLETFSVSAPQRLKVGAVAEIRVAGADEVKTEDRFGFFNVRSLSTSRIRAKLKRAGAGRAVLFLRCRVGNVQWLEPVAFATLPHAARDIQPRTVTNPMPEGTRYVPVDLSEAYNDDIQTCFKHRWKWDAYDFISGRIAYWTMPLFRLSRPMPRRVRVGDVPFLLGPMGPGDAVKHKDLLMLANTPPRELPTRATIHVGRKLHKFYVLSLNMNLPQKCYVPAVEVRVRYADGKEQVNELIPPSTFDTFYQDYGIDTMALPLPVKPTMRWVGYGGVNLAQHHLTMTDVACDPQRGVDTIQFRAIATETFFGLAGLTLIPASQ